MSKKNHVHSVLLEDAEEKFAPMSMEGLDVCVIGDEVFLDVVKVEESHEKTTIERVASVTVNKRELLAAIEMLSEGK